MALIIFISTMNDLKPIKQIDLEINKDHSKKLLSSEERYKIIKNVSKNSPWRKWNPNWL